LAVVAAAAANTAADSIDTSALSEDDAATFDFLVTAVIAGKTVKKIVVTITADKDTAACASSFTKMDLTSDDGACTATASRRRNLLAAYSTSVLLNPDKVDTTAAEAAVTALEMDLGSDVVTFTDENPVDEIEAIDGVDSTEVATFRTAATAAVEANVEAEAYKAEESSVDDCTVSADGTVSCSGTSSVSTVAALAAAACVFA
jgi:hypothetical protein|tara:strand:+ start:984 stop:1592 length:609 start_codon:yes stop_codon:yes gene_type:complete